MPLEDDIPELAPEHRDLLTLLRAAINDDGPPPSLKLRRIQWEKVLEIARFHQVDMFLYPHVAQWLKKGSLNEIPSETHQSEIGIRQSKIPFQPPSDELLAGWRMDFFGAVLKYEQASAQLKEILEALREAGVRVIPLKGAWLAEKVYEEGACRPMCDFDLLVPREKLDCARAVFEGLGYATPDHYFDPARDKDIHYRHPDRPMMIELHFRVWHEGKTNVVAPDTDRLWVDPVEDTLHGIPVLTFPPERQLCYLVQHILHHSLTIGLKAYVDLVLLIRKDRFNAEKLEAEADALGVPFGAKFITQIALDLAGMEPTDGLARFLAPVGLSVPTPPRTGETPVPTHNGGHEKERRMAFRAILEMTGESSGITPAIEAIQTASLARRVQLALARIFYAPSELRSAYPEAVKRFGLPGGYVARSKDVVRRRSRDWKNSKKSADVENYQERKSLSQWILSKDAC